eukprot:scaffold77_cov116-Isochrysis_galbana.AAC.6
MVASRHPRREQAARVTVARTLPFLERGPSLANPTMPSRLFLKPEKKDLTEKKRDDLVGFSIVPRTNTCSGSGAVQSGSVWTGLGEGRELAPRSSALLARAAR